MKNYYCYFIILSSIILFIFSSCHKKNDIETIHQNDSIYYYDFSPDTSETSINYWYSGLPLPADSSADINIDISNDGIMDLKAYVYTSYYWVSNGNPEANYSYGSGLIALRTTDSIASIIHPYPLDEAKAFPIDSVISNNSSYSNSVSCYKTWSGGDPFTCNTFSGETYYGIKLSNKNNFYYGWILMSFDFTNNRLIIKEFALNKTPNKSIKAGQKQ
jgi:hypothetical protein